jgi:hypothetical protein
MHFNRHRFSQDGRLIAWPSIRTLDRKSGMSTKTVRTAIQTLQQSKMLEVQPRYDASQRRHKSNFYLALTPIADNCIQGSPEGRVTSAPAVVYPGPTDSLSDPLNDPLTHTAARYGAIALRSRRSSLFDKVVQIWGKPARSIIGKACAAGLDNYEIEPIIAEAVDEGDDINDFARRLFSSGLIPFDEL